MTWDKMIKMLAAIGGGIAGMFGAWDTMMTVLMCAMVIDYITGWITAAIGHSVKTADGRLNSEVAWKGLAKKGLSLLFVLFGALLDQAIGQDVFRNAMCWFYVATEGLSILENLALAGVPFPGFIKNALEQVQQRDGKPPDPTSAIATEASEKEKQ